MFYLKALSFAETLAANCILIGVWLIEQYVEASSYDLLQKIMLTTKKEQEKYIRIICVLSNIRTGQLLIISHQSDW